MGGIGNNALRTIAIQRERRVRRIPEATITNIVVGMSPGQVEPPPPPPPHICHDFVDTFNRADGGLGSDWALINDSPLLDCFAIFTYPASSPAAICTGNGGSAYYTGYQTYTDAVITANLVGNLASAAIMDIWARGGVNNSTGYFFRIVPTSGAMSIRTAGGALVSGVGTVTQGALATVELAGTTLRFTFGGTTISVTDGTYTVGRIGMHAGALGGPGWDNFEIDECGGSAGGGVGGGGGGSEPDAGYTTRIPSDSSQIVYLDTVGGSDALGQVYDSATVGDDPREPLISVVAYKTLAAAVAAGLRDGHPDWLLIKRGTTCTEKFPGWGLGGQDADNPMVIDAYGDFATARPIMQPFDGDTLFFSVASVLAPKGYLHIRSLRCVSTQNGITTTPYAFGFRGYWRDIEFEDVEIYRFWCGIAIESENPGSINIPNVTLRKCTFRECFRGAGQSGNPQGAFFDGVIGTFRIIDCVWDHNGWRRGVDGGSLTGDDPALMPYPTRSHGFYISVNCGPVEVTDGYCFDTLSDGNQPRGGGTVTGGFYGRNPMALICSRVTIVDGVTIMDSRNENNSHADYHRAHGIQFTGDAGSTAGSAARNVVCAYRTADPAPVNKACISLDHAATGVSLEHVTSWEWPGDSTVPVDVSPDSAAPTQSNCHFNTAPSEERDIAQYLVDEMGLAVGSDALDTFAALVVLQRNGARNADLEVTTVTTWLRAVFTI